MLGGSTYTIWQFMVFSVLFFLNNQPDALIIPILFCCKTLHVSGIFSAHHQEFSTVHSALLSFMQVSDDRFQAVRMFHPGSAWKRSSETCMKLTSAECAVGISWWWAEKMPETCSVL